MIAAVSITATLVLSAATLRAEQSPVKAEMLMLDRAYRDIVSAVALGDSDGVLKAVQSVEASFEKTAKAMEAGTIVLPRNQERIKEFEKMDKEFHKNLEQLAEAAKKKNKSNTLKITKRLIDGCIKCHQSFRD